MTPFAGNPTFIAYVYTTAILIVNLVFLWVWSGVVRGRTKIAINEEDAARFKTEHDPVDPPAVARVLRAHLNATATIYPFLLLGLLFVFLDGSVHVARIAFGVFVAARLAHSFVYLRAVQPARTIMFVLSLLAIGALLVEDVWLAYSHA